MATDAAMTTTRQGGAMPKEKPTRKPGHSRRLDHASFQMGSERITIWLLHQPSDPARPYRIHVIVRHGKVLVTSGYYGLDSREDAIRKAFAHAKESALQKGWRPAQRSGRRPCLLDALPEPSPKALRAAG